MLKLARYFKPKYYFTIAAAVLVVVLLLAAPPRNFPDHTLFTVQEGWNVSETTQALLDKGFIDSPLLFKLAFRMQGAAKVIISGDYFWNRPKSIWSLVGDLASGNYGLELVRITIPEGVTARQMSKIIKQRLPDFDEEAFVSEAEPLEGYLFPDTYSFPPTADADQVLSLLHSNFDRKIDPLKRLIADSGRSLKQIVIMASLVEKEASLSDVRREIAGILWKRLDNGMPLQVDSVFPYIISKNTFELTIKDLNSDSPYNTYRYRGLPPGAISNPGLDAIMASLEPADTPYWYFLSDRRGETHYAVDFEEHKLNKARYLQ